MAAVSSLGSASASPASAFAAPLRLDSPRFHAGFPPNMGCSVWGKFSLRLDSNGCGNGCFSGRSLSPRFGQPQTMGMNCGNGSKFYGSGYFGVESSRRALMVKCQKSFKHGSGDCGSTKLTGSSTKSLRHSWARMKKQTEMLFRNAHSLCLFSLSSQLFSMKNFQNAIHHFSFKFPSMSFSRRMVISFGIITFFVAVMNVSDFAALHKSWALTEENLLFLEAWRTIDRAYVDKTFNGQTWFRYRQEALKNDPMNNREQTYAAIRKMLASLDDPFTKHLEPDKFKTLKSGTTGAVTGVGLEVGFNDAGNLVVVSPVSNGPADRAGIVPGDQILTIDDVSTLGMGLYEAAQRLQGPIQSEVKLSVLPSNQAVPIVYNIIREKISLNPVSYQLCTFPSNDVRLGYIRLSTFNQNSANAVKEAIRSLQDAKVNSFVLDMRNNGGGLFPAGIEIAKYWLDKGVIVYIADSVGIKDVYESDGSSVLSVDEPLTVLVNKGTASASEILAGALKDNRRAKILGETTFGKGKIQSIFELSDGSGLAVTIARYQTPNQIDIDKVGILPDEPLPEGIPMDDTKFCSYVQQSVSDDGYSNSLLRRALLAPALKE